MHNQQNADLVGMTPLVTYLAVSITSYGTGYEPNRHHRAGAADTLEFTAE
jgi:hypothetical protein